MTANDLDRLALRVQLPGFAGTTLDDNTRRLLEEGLGGVCLFGSNTVAGLDPLSALVADVRAAGHARVVVAVDEEGGDVTRVHAATGSPVPGAAALGAADDLSWTREVGDEVGALLAELGATLTLAPVADLNTEPDNPVIGVRSFGTDPERTARHVAAWVAGVQGRGVAACAKHFPGHGDTRHDSHLTLPTLGGDLETLHGRELVPFTAAVQAGVAAVMTGHLVVPAVEPDVPATLSPAAHRLLRHGLGFDGAVVTDALDMAGASAGRGLAEAAVEAVVAGADLLCLGTDTGEHRVRQVQAALVGAVHQGRLPEERLREAAARVDRLAQGAVPAPCSAVLGAAETRLNRHADRIRAALAVHGDLGRLHGALTVLVDTDASIAVGPVPWGLRADVVLGLEDVEIAGVARTLGRRGTRPVVLQVRDAHRHPAVVRLAEELGDAGPTVVVEWGWPGPWPPRVPRVCAYGSSLPAHVAVRALLGDHGYPPPGAGAGR